MLVWLWLWHVESVLITLKLFQLRSDYFCLWSFLHALCATGDRRRREEDRKRREGEEWGERGNELAALVSKSNLCATASCRWCCANTHTFKHTHIHTPTPTHTHTERLRPCAFNNLIIATMKLKLRKLSLELDCWSSCFACLTRFRFSTVSSA